MKNLLNALIITLLSFTSYVSYAGGGQPDQPLYYVIEDPFTINFLRQSDEQARYLQVKVALKSEDPAILSSAENNLPMIQDTLRILFAEQNMDSVKVLKVVPNSRKKLISVLKPFLKKRRVTAILKQCISLPFSGNEQARYLL